MGAVTREERIADLARSILQADASLGDDGLYEILPDGEGGTYACRVDDPMLALAAYDLALRQALGR